MNPRRFVRTLIVLLVTIVVRWIAREQATPPPEPQREPTPPPLPVAREPEKPLEAIEERGDDRPPAVATFANAHPGDAPVVVLEAPVAMLEEPSVVPEASETLPTVERASDADVATPVVASTNGSRVAAATVRALTEDPAPVPERRRTRRRSEASAGPGRLLGGAGFLLAAIACFIASFVLFVRLTTPDRSAPAVYAVVPYVAASERDVPPAVATFTGEIASKDMWLVLRLPVAARYVAMTGLRTIDRWNTMQFTLVGTKPTSPTNVGSCYSGAGVPNGPPELTPLSAGLVVRDTATASLTTERLTRVDVGGLLADASSIKTLVCAIAPPARTGFATYGATIGVPNVPASDGTDPRVKLSAIPLAIDYSAFGNAAAMRFTQTSLAVATDPLHATLDVAGFESFAYDDPEGDARRDVLLFVAGALATIGAVATADALRPWLGIERR